MSGRTTAGLGSRQRRESRLHGGIRTTCGGRLDDVDKSLAVGGVGKGPVTDSLRSSADGNDACGEAEKHGNHDQGGPEHGLKTGGVWFQRGEEGKGGQGRGGRIDLWTGAITVELPT